jgi:histidine triad (HIT) family protein
MDCLFCKITKKEIAAKVVYEDKETLAFLDIQPRATGHTIVIPKTHAENIIDLNDENIEPTFLTVKKITGILKNALKADGFTIGINHGRISGQAVDHLHIHIIPRFKNDGGGSIHTVVNNPPEESLGQIVNRIAKAKND